MSDDIIRKAVELADNFQCDDCNHGFFHEFGLAPEDFISTFWDEPEQYLLDALAAQLVRQVDALVFYRLIIEPTGVDIESEATGDRIAEARHGDRTMNTIKAIVDSEVLEGK